MTYDASERSFQSGAPVELYEFVRRNVDLSTPCSPSTVDNVIYRYTSADTDITFNTHTWTSKPIQRSAIESTPEQARSSIQIRAQRDLEVADLFRVYSPTDVIAVTVYRYHRDDNNSAVIWMGRVLNCEWRGAEATLNCEPVSTSLRRPGLRRLYQKSCPHVLYSSACGVPRAGSDTTVTDITGLNVTVAALAAGPYAGGFIEHENGAGIFDKQFISDASGLVLTLVQPIQGLQVGDAVTVYRGCDHTMATCKDVFSNLPNYGGFPFIPSKNPFDGTPVY